MKPNRAHAGPYGQRSLLSALLLLGSVVAAPVVGAHHSAAMFDHEKVTEITGEVKEFQWTNPHVWIQVNVESDAGLVEWSVEGGGPNSLSRQGWRPSTFTPGASVTLRINPMLDGTPAGGFVGARFEDGSTIGRWD
jgi:hypothetical protein